MERRIAAIDLGTVSSRLALATLRDGKIASMEKRTVITDLGEGVDATGRFCAAAIERVLDACRGFSELIAAFGPEAVGTTLTSAARDAANGEELLAGLRALGLAPQVISGEVEARLTFRGVASDFPGERIAVADSGGGSTELACGQLASGEALELEAVSSLDVGCRRVTERFLVDAPPTAEQLEAAAVFAREMFAPYWGRLGSEARPARLVAVGGTVTTLVAMMRELEPYDSSLVHLCRLTLDEIEACVERLHVLATEEIALLPGVQPKRAPVLLAGVVIIRELLRASGFSELTVSENSLLAGLVTELDEALG